MALFRQKGRKTWQSRIYVPELKRQKSFSTGTSDKLKATEIDLQLQKAAKKLQTKEKIAAILEVLMGEPVEHLRISEIFEEYKKFTKVVDYSVKKKKQRWNTFLSWLAVEYPFHTYVKDIDQEVCLAFFGWLEEGRKGKTLNNWKGDISSLWTAMVKLGKLDRNPWSCITKYKTDESKTGRAFTPDEVKRILEVSQGTIWYGPVIAGLYTGLRQKDIYWLRWSDIKDGIIKLKPSKTIDRQVKVFIPIHAELKKVLAMCDKNKEFVFADFNGRDIDGGYCGFKQLVLDPAGIEKISEDYEITFHCLRHTWRTALSRSNADKEVVKIMGGWVDDDQQEHYNHHKERFEAAIGCLSF